MARRVVVEEGAEADLGRAFEWYESRQVGLGSEFLAEVARVFQSIERFPEGFQVVQGRTRRALLQRFPYGIFYVIESDIIGVTSCLHARRDPASWPGAADV